MLFGARHARHPVCLLCSKNVLPLRKLPSSSFLASPSGSAEQVLEQGDVVAELLNEPVLPPQLVEAQSRQKKKRKGRAGQRRPAHSARQLRIGG
eukprot:747597-Hanusia_phi.AAC.1